MSFNVKYREPAKREADELLRTYSREFGTEFKQWLSELAHAAESHDDSVSIDAIEALRDAGEVPPAANQFDYVWMRLRHLSVQEKLHAFLQSLRTRQLPFQCRFASRVLTVLESITCEFHLFYEIDYVRERLVVTRIDMVDPEADVVDDDSFEGLSN